MSDEISERLSRAEWEITSVKEAQQRHETRMDRHDERMGAMSERMDAHHREVMGAINGLREDQQRREGAQQAREEDAKKRQNMIKLISMIAAVVTVLMGLGLINTASGAEREPVHVVD